MATIKRFEDIQAWQDGCKLAIMIYNLTKSSGLSKDHGLKEQIQRAAVSVSSNIAEGFARSGNKEFVNFLWIAKGSAAEVQSQLYIAKEIGYITEEEFHDGYKLAEYCSIIIYKLIKSIRSSPLKGHRYT